MAAHFQEIIPNQYFVTLIAAQNRPTCDSQVLVKLQPKNILTFGPTDMET